MRYSVILASLAALLASCTSEQDVEATTPAGGAAPAITTGANCTAAFARPRVGATVVLDGRTAAGDRERYGYSYKVIAVGADDFQVEETMLVGDSRSEGPVDAEVRRDGFIFLSDGPTRRYVYEGLAQNAVQGMKPGSVLEIPMVERSDFGQEAGKGEARGSLRIKFEGCSTIEVAGVNEPVKVFRVDSVGRAYDARAAGGATDRTVQASNRYWVSERLGLELRRDMSPGYMVAIAISPKT